MIMRYSIVGEIQEGLCESMKAIYDDSCESVHVYINSVGGSLVEGLAITEWLQALVEIGKPVTVEAVKAYSAASVIFLGEGFLRKVAPNAEKQFLMIHRPTLYGMTGDDLRYATEIITELEEQMIDKYVQSGIERDEAVKLVSEETYFDKSLAQDYNILAVKRATKSTTNMAEVENKESILNEIKAQFSEMAKSLKDALTGKVKAEGEEMQKEGETEKSPLEIEIEDLKAKLMESESKCAALQAECDKYKSEASAAAGQAAAAMEAVKNVEAKLSEASKRLDVLDQVKADAGTDGKAVGKDAPLWQQILAQKQASREVAAKIHAL